MTDKIITTFETNLTWYCPSDKLPHIDFFEDKNDTEYLIKLKNGEIELAHFFIPVDEDEQPYFGKDSWCYHPDKIAWWCYLPEFN